MDISAWLSLLWPNIQTKFYKDAVLCWLWVVLSSSLLLPRIFTTYFCSQNWATLALLLDSECLHPKTAGKCIHPFLARATELNSKAPTTHRSGSLCPRPCDEGSSVWGPWRASAGRLFPLSLGGDVIISTREDVDGLLHGPLLLSLLLIVLTGNDVFK